MARILFSLLLGVFLLAKQALAETPARGPMDLDMKIMSDGTVFILDTDHNWKELSGYTKVEVQSEAQGKPAFLQQPTWIDYWRLRFSAVHRNQEHYQKYLAFILERRRRARLPELPADITALAK